MYAAAPRAYPAVAAVNALGNRTTTMFDAAGNPDALIDARGNRHSFVYDAADREVALRDPLSRRAGCVRGGASLPGRRTTSGYDQAGNQTLRIDARGHRTTYTFDAASQLQARRYPDGSRVTFAWDETGNRTLMADATGRYTWLSDALNRTSVNRQPNCRSSGL